MLPSDHSPLVFRLPVRPLYVGRELWVQPDECRSIYASSKWTLRKIPSTLGFLAGYPWTPCMSWCFDRQHSNSTAGVGPWCLIAAGDYLEVVWVSEAVLCVHQHTVCPGLHFWTTAEGVIKGQSEGKVCKASRASDKSHFYPWAVRFCGIKPALSLRLNFSTVV